MFANGTDLVKQFEALLGKFKAVQDNVSSASSQDAARFRQLLADFRISSARADNAEVARTKNLPENFTHLLKEFSTAIERWRQSQEQTADDFNLLDVMGITGCETMHSGVLAWLLSRDITGFGTLGTHGQGSLGLKLFLAELRAELEMPNAYALANYWVHTEVRGNDSIIDIEVACRGQFIIHIENKIWSNEGLVQTPREWLDLAKRAESLNIPETGRHALFLTPRGIEAEEPRFKPISWFRVARVFEQFAQLAKPSEVKVFCSHYAGALRRSIVKLDELKEADDGKANVQRGRVVFDPELGRGPGVGGHDGEGEGEAPGTV